jgi:hypothetical protein
MLKRFRRIYNEFGTRTLIGSCILFIGSIAIALADLFIFSGIGSALTAIIGLSLGALLRVKIIEGFEYLAPLRSGTLFIYPIVIFFGKQFGLSTSALLAIITLVTVTVFNLQFWALSDLSIINTERDVQQ